MSTLSQNTTDLQALLAQVNALPEADGGDVDAILDELHEYAQSIISGGDME